jgi:hypothetical protein
MPGLFSPAMEHYRAYLIGLDGHFLKVVDILTEMTRQQASVRGNLLAVTTWNYGKETAKFALFKHEPK